MVSPLSNPPHPLDAVLTPERTGETTCTLHIPEGWEQGKTIFGGLVLGALVRAMQTQEPDGARRLRSLTAELVGAPVPGDASISLRTIRRGKAVTTVSAELAQAPSPRESGGRQGSTREGGVREESELCTHAVAVFGSDRALAEPMLTLERPSMPSWKDVPLVDLPIGLAPPFSQHFEYRPVMGLPFSGSAPEASGWLRPRIPPQTRDAALVTALADAWWICEMVTMTTPRPAATMSFALDLHTPLSEIDPSAPIFHHGKALARTNGYASEVRTLWSEDGRLLAVNRQLVVIIK